MQGDILPYTGFGRKFMIHRLAKRLNMHHTIIRAKARQIRILWFLYRIGNVWVSYTELCQLGAGQWHELKYSIPDCVTDGLIEQIQVGSSGNRFKYKITKEGLKVLKESIKYIQEEYDREVAKIDKYRDKHGIDLPDWL